MPKDINFTCHVLVQWSLIKGIIYFVLSRVELLLLIGNGLDFASLLPYQLSNL